MSAKTRVRALTAVVIFGLAGASLVGCSSTSGGGSQTLTVGSNGDTAMKAVVKKFENDNPGVTIQLKNTPENYDQITSTQLTGGNAPDVIQIEVGSGNNDSAVKAGDKGYFTNLSGESFASKIPADARRVLNNTKGQLMGVPMTFSSIAGVYNATAMKSVGLTAPTTWPEVLQFCADAKAKGKVAYGLGLSDTWTTQLIPYALVATLVYGKDPTFTERQLKGDESFSNSGWKKAMAMYVEMGKQGCFNASPAGTPYATVQHAVASGSTLGTVTVAAETAAIKALAPKTTDIEYQTFPASDVASDNYLSANVGPSFAVNSKAKNQALAKKFLAYLATPSTQIAYATAYGDTAAMPGNLKQDSQVATLVSGYVKSKKIAGWPDNEWPSTAVQQDVFSGVQGIFSNQATVKSVLAKMDSDFDAAK